MNNIKQSQPDPIATSTVRQKLSRLSCQQKEILDTLIDSDQMVIGSVFEVYKTCSKPNCCCQRGEKHGPFTAISYSIEAQIHHRMVREEDKVAIVKDVGTYKAFQKNRKLLRQVQRDINEQLDVLKKIQSREYK